MPGYFIFLYFIIYMLCHWPIVAYSNFESLSENQSRYVIPLQNIEQIKSNISKTFTSRPIFLDQKYRLSINEQRLFEMYFDTPDLFFYNNNGELVYRSIEYLTKKKKKKKYHESIHYSSGQHEQHIFSVKHYNNVKTLEEKHPLLSLVKRKERDTFINQLKNAGIQHPVKIRSIFHSAKITHSYTIFQNDKQILQFSVSHIELNRFTNNTQFGMLDITVNPEEYALLSEENRVFLESAINTLTKDFSKSSNLSRVNQYLINFAMMSKDIPFFTTLLKYPALVNLAYSIAITIIGLLILKLMFWKRFFVIKNKEKNDLQ